MNDVAMAALEALLPWSTPREGMTKRGLRIMRKAKPTEAFWRAWSAGKDQLRAHGIGVAKSEFAGGDWEVTWWREIPQDIQDARAEVVEMSRATDADIDVPCPDGLAYMPFQRAGIAFVLAKADLTFGKNIRSPGGVSKDNGPDRARLASDTDQARKGVIPTPSRGDSCGVLIADEMG